MVQGRRHEGQLVHYLQVELDGADGAVTKTVGHLPPGSTVLDVITNVTTAFDAGTVDIGTAATADELDAAVTLNAAAVTRAAVDGYYAAATEIKAAVSGAATSGTARIAVTYIPPDDG